MSSGRIDWPETISEEVRDGIIDFVLEEAGEKSRKEIIKAKLREGCGLVIVLEGKNLEKTYGDSVVFYQHTGALFSCPQVFFSSIVKSAKKKNYPERTLGEIGGYAFLEMEKVHKLLTDDPSGFTLADSYLQTRTNLQGMTEEEMTAIRRAVDRYKQLYNETSNLLFKMLM